MLKGKVVKRLLGKANSVFCVLLLLGVFNVALSSAVHASSDVNNEASVMSTFVADQKAKGERGAVAEESKHRVLFWMGVILLVLVLVTAGIGINMAFFGKEVFIPHMVFAGATVFLSIAHAVTAIVWFFPY